MLKERPEWPTLQDNFFVLNPASTKRLRQGDGDRRNKQDYLRFARKEEWIMPPEKKSTKGKKAKRDIFNFIKDATKKNSAVGMKFYNEVNKKGVKAKDIYQLLIDWGYDVRLEEVTKLWKLYKTSPIVKKYAIESAY
jgi:hypothetical protein